MVDFTHIFASGTANYLPSNPLSSQKTKQNIPRLLVAQCSHVTKFWASYKLEGLCRTLRKAP